MLSMCRLFCVSLLLLVEPETARVKAKAHGYVRPNTPKGETNVPFSRLFGHI